jgi:hypothetical protein
MKKKRKSRQLSELETKTEKSFVEPEETPNQNRLLSLKRNWLILLIIGVVTLGTLGAGLKYLEEDARRQLTPGGSLRVSKGAEDAEESTFLNKLNPFLPAALPVPTPQLSKEYLFAGSRLLAVEDANANAAPPADLAVWRPSSGQWWVMGGTGSQQVNFTWGMTGDVPVPGDYDGDGKTDFSIFRPSSNTWWVMKSSDNTYYSNTFGASGDKVAQADYDGDGKTDVAIFRPDSAAHLGTWYIQRTSDSGVQILQFGLDTDQPAPADYDGDGRADIGVWRSSTNAFYSVNSSNNQLQTPTFGQTGNTVVSGDYDGDGKADYAIYNGATANWAIRQSTNNQTVSYQWGNANDKAVQNDYDGDGKVDIATWRNSNGNWYIRKSGANGALRQVQWGMAGDYPVPAYYRR